MDRSVISDTQPALSVGQWLTFGELQALARAGERTFVVAAAVEMVARREHSRAEITRKLRQRGYSPAAAEYALERLHQRNYQSDSRFAREWVRSHMSGSGRSRRAILAGLQRAGVDRELAEQTVRDYVAENPGGFEYALERAAATVRLVPREKQIQRLLRRGFDLVEIRKYFD